jgi:DNA-binding GntR family transcriptional regulator
MRIADELRRAIYSGTLAPGEPLPTYAEISAQYDGAATGTVSNAVKVLIGEGLVVSKPGARSYVRERPRPVRLMRAWGRRPGSGSPWASEMAARGHVGSWRSSSQPEAAPAAVAERLRIEPGAPTMRTRYVFLLDGKADHLSTSWEPLELTGETDIMLPESGPYAGAGVQDRMAAIGHAPDEVEETVSPHPLTIAEAQELGLQPGIACVAIERTYLEGERPLETATIILPPHYQATYRLPLG